MQPYYVNVSAINDYMRCPFRWWAKWVRNRVPLKETQPLAFGKLLHLIFEDFHKNGDMSKAIASRRIEWQGHINNLSDLGDIAVGTKVLAQLDDMTEALKQWHDVYSFDKTLEVEEPFELDLGDNIILRGRPDRVALQDNTIWHIQHKGLAAGTNFAVFTDLAKRSYHEHAYAEALAKKYPQYKYGGTMFDLIRKLKYRTNVTLKNPEGKVKTYAEMFQQIPIPINLTSSLHLHVMDCIQTHIINMRKAEAEWKELQLTPAPNENMNGGMFGNSPDEYFRVLTGDITLEDNLYFKDRTDMYEVTENESDS